MLPTRVLLYEVEYIFRHRHHHHHHVAHPLEAKVSNVLI